MINGETVGQPNEVDLTFVPPASRRAGIYDGDGVRQYLTVIGEIELLNADDEYRLGEAISIGRQARERLQLDRQYNDTLVEWGYEPVEMDPALKKELDEQIKIADKASNDFAEANTRLVVSIAKKYFGRGLKMDDLIQEGNVGLVWAVEKFDHTKGFKFSTYATWWIKQKIRVAVRDQSRNIRLTKKDIENLTNLNVASADLRLVLGREASTKELANKTGLTEVQVIDLLLIADDTLSLDKPKYEDGSSDLTDTISLPVDSDVSITTILNRDQILKLMNDANLNTKERVVIALRFGLIGGLDQQLGKKVSALFGVTRSRIGQIEASALRKLRIAAGVDPDEAHNEPNRANRR